MANILGYVSIGLSGLTLLLTIIALASDQWQSVYTVGFESKIGLWKSCRTSMGKETCRKKEMGKSIDACKALLFLAIFATTGAIASAILLMVVMKDTQKLLFIAGGLDIASRFFLMIAMAVYDDKCKLHVYGTDLDYGFALDIIAWLAAWAAGGIFIASKFLTKV